MSGEAVFSQEVDPVHPRCPCNNGSIRFHPSCDESFVLDFPGVFVCGEIFWVFGIPPNVIRDTIGAIRKIGVLPSSSSSSPCPDNRFPVQGGRQRRCSSAAG